MKFEEVLPAHRTGKDIYVVDGMGKIPYNFHSPKTISIVPDYILMDTWGIEPDKCSHCNGTGREPPAFCGKICSCGQRHVCGKPLNHSITKLESPYCYCKGTVP